MSRQIQHRAVDVDGVKVFYREAGHRRNPSVLLLHGFPTSSVMFKTLMVALADNYHLVAPDYPGFGFSDFPPPAAFDYSFDGLGACMARFTDVIGLRSFTIYLHDYGCPIGLRVCMRHPDRIARIIVQNGNAYMEGIGPQWDETRDYWAHPSEEKKCKVAAFLSAQGVRMQYTAGLGEELLARVSPEAWILDWERMRRPGNVEMQFALNCSYASNLALFPAFQQYLRQHQVPALVLWGRHDAFFDVAEAPCYRRDLPDARIHVLDGGHMLLETNFDETIGLIEDFLRSAPG